MTPDEANAYLAIANTFWWISFDSAIMLGVAISVVVFSWLLDRH